MSELEEIKNFTVSFFTSLKSNLFWDDGGKKLTITTIPESFERFYGKRGPYILVFSQADVKNGEEPMVRGSFLLNCMREYLQDKGQTTLVKIDFDFEPKEELKNYIRLKNCNIASITKQQSYDWLVRFTFLTTLQYLNEKEQVMNSIYVKGNEIIKFDLDKYKTIEGKKEEINILDIKGPYNSAKEHLKTLIQPKLEKISEILNKKLEKETERVKNHYLNQIAEDKQNLEKSERLIREIRQQLADENNKELDRDFANIRIKRLQENIAALKSEKRKAELAKEESFFLNDENAKHSLGIDNKIMNTTIAYFPIYKYSTFLKNHDATRILDLVYNPLTKSLSKLNCEVCNKEIRELYLCTSGHICCGGCLRACLECQNEYCIKCLQTSCFSCGKKLCRKCAKKCTICGKYKCKSHMKTNSTCETCSSKASTSSLRRPSFSFS